MPELPEVEVLARHLAPALKHRVIRGIHVHRAKVLAPTTVSQFRRALLGARFESLARHGKYLVFTLKSAGAGRPLTLLGHLGMTGRLYLARLDGPLPKHAAVVLDLDGARLIYEDPRYFGRLTLDATALARLGPDALGPEFTRAHLAAALQRSAQSVKVKLLDQKVLAGVGNIYASEALFRARIPPRRASRRLTADQVTRLWRAIRAVLAEAIAWGSTVPLAFGPGGERDGLFYYGRAAGTPDDCVERLRVYDRAGAPCPRCGSPIRRVMLAGRSTYFCPKCQR